MTNPIRDPEGSERRELRQIPFPFQGRTIEIGAGEGRLIRTYADETALTVGLDVKLSRLRDGLRSRRLDHVHYTAGQAEHLPFPGEFFDLAVLGWSL